MSDIRSQALSRAYELVEAGKNDEARTVLEPILLNTPDNVDAWWIYAHAVTEPSDARRALRNVTRIDPDYPGAADLLRTLDEQYPETAASPSTPPPVTIPAGFDDEPDFMSDDLDDDVPAYSPAMVVSGDEPSRNWLPIAIVAAIVVLLFVVLVLILPSLTSPATPTPTQPEVAGNVTPPPTTALIIAPEETEQPTESAAATEAVVTEVVVVPVESPTLESEPSLTEEVLAETQVAILPETATAVPENTPAEAATVAATAVETVPTESPTLEASSVREVTLAVAPEATAEAVTEPTESDVTPASENTAEATPTAEVARDFTDELLDGLQTVTLAPEPTEITTTSFGQTLLVRVCTTEGRELRTALSSVMDSLVTQAAIVPEDLAAVGVHLLDCEGGRTLRIITVDTQSLAAYNDGELERGQFEAAWRAEGF